MKLSRTFWIWVAVIIAAAIVLFLLLQNRGGTGSETKGTGTGSGSGSGSRSGNNPKSAPKPKFDCKKLLKRNVKGEEVKELQRFLNQNGASLTVDGSFGPATEQALGDYFGGGYTTYEVTLATLTGYTECGASGSTSDWAGWDQDPSESPAPNSWDYLYTMLFGWL